MAKQTSRCRTRLTLVSAVIAPAALLAQSAHAVAVPSAVPAGTITTIAGGVGGPGPGPSVALGYGCGVASADGVSYVATEPDSLIRAISVQTGMLTTVAGVGLARTTGDGGPATSAGLDLNDCSVAVDHAGNLLVDQNDRIRVVMKTTGIFYGAYRQAGDIYTIAGGGTKALRDGAPATAVSIGFSTGVAVDPSGNVVLSVWANKVLLVAVRSGTYYGVRTHAGDIYTIAGDGTAGFAGNRGPARRAELKAPSGVAVDSAGNLLIADQGNHRVRIVPARSGRYFGRTLRADDIYTVAGDGQQGPLGLGGNARYVPLDGPQQVAVDASGNLLIADGRDDSFGVVAARTADVYGVNLPAGDITTLTREGFGYDAAGIAVDSSGNLVLEDGSFVLRVWAEHTGQFYGQHMQAGSLYAIAGDDQYNAVFGGSSGDGGSALEAQFGMATGMAVDSHGNLAIVDRGQATVRLVARSTGTFYGQAMTAGDMYTIAAHSGQYGLYGISFDQAGNLIMTTGNFGAVLVEAQRTGSFYGQQMTAGQSYLIGGHGTQTGDGIPATSANLSYVSGVTVDASGNVLIADSTDGADSVDDRVRCIAGSSGTFYGQAMTAGDVYTIAGTGTGGFSGDGGPATDAGVDPHGLALDAHGNIVIADTGNNRVRVVAAATGTFYGQAMTAGDIYTIAGTGTNANNGDGGAATSAAISGPWDQSVAVDPAGNVVVAAKNQVRVIAAATGTFYGVPMTAGNIYTVAGTGISEFTGDGGPATSAEFAEVDSVALDQSGALLVGDFLRVRSISP